MRRDVSIRLDTWWPHDRHRSATVGNAESDLRLHLVRSLPTDFAAILLQPVQQRSITGWLS